MASVTRCCPNCGGDEAGAATRVQRGPLVVDESPRAAWWKGRKLDLAPRHLEILHLLARRGKASHLALELVTKGGLDSTAVKVHVSHMRARLASAGIPITIRNERGWGYALEMEA